MLSAGAALARVRLGLVLADFVRVVRLAGEGGAAGADQTLPARRGAASISLYQAVTVRSMSCRNASGSSLPRSISCSRFSHFAVSAGDFTASTGRLWISAIPLSVAESVFFERTAYPRSSSVSMIASRVAGVPIPATLGSAKIAFNSSSSSSLPAPIMADSSVLSVNRLGGSVCFSLPSYWPDTTSP